MSPERGSVFTAPARSSTERSGDLALTASTIGKLPTSTMDSKSFSGFRRRPA
jgi:hypothetical protein